MPGRYGRTAGAPGVVSMPPVRPAQEQADPGGRIAHVVGPCDRGGELAARCPVLSGHHDDEHQAGAEQETDRDEGRGQPGGPPAGAPDQEVSRRGRSPGIAVGAATSVRPSW